MLKKFVTLVLGILILLAAIPVARANSYDPVWDWDWDMEAVDPNLARFLPPRMSYIPVYGGGTHPWDARREMMKLRPQQIPIEVYTYSPFRSVTHALHPFFRNTYYAPAVPLAYRYERRRSQYFAPAVQEPTVSCGAYSYARPNYRTPPYEYEC